MANPSFAVIIPARLASKRLPGKVLLRKTGKYLIQHVWEQLRPLAAADAIIIATDSEEVRAAAESFGATVAMTRADHPSGTDRVAEVARDLAVDVVVNVQGDEPTIDPADVALLVEPFGAGAELDMATLARRRADPESQLNPNLVKVVTDSRGYALYFSRAPIPFAREGAGLWLHHIGAYAYRRNFLLGLSSLPPTPLESVERLEQLRVLENGHRIKVVVTDKVYEGIDTESQYEAFVEGYTRARRLSSSEHR
jgi:3-deoxy-manno-octulosonate cytidylyltransferase (CMP-KDO synthetase)